MSRKRSSGQNLIVSTNKSLNELKDQFNRQGIFWIFRWHALFNMMNKDPCQMSVNYDYKNITFMNCHIIYNNIENSPTLKDRVYTLDDHIVYIKTSSRTCYPDSREINNLFIKQEKAADKYLPVVYVTISPFYLSIFYVKDSVIDLNFSSRVQDFKEEHGLTWNRIKQLDSIQFYNQMRKVYDDFGVDFFMYKFTNQFSEEFQTLEMVRRWQPKLFRIYFNLMLVKLGLRNGYLMDEPNLNITSEELNEIKKNMKDIDITSTHDLDENEHLVLFYRKDTPAPKVPFDYDYIAKHYLGYLCAGVGDWFDTTIDRYAVEFKELYTTTSIFSFMCTMETPKKDIERYCENFITQCGDALHPYIIKYEIKKVLGVNISELLEKHQNFKYVTQNWAKYKQIIEDLNLKSCLLSIKGLQTPREIKLFYFYMQYHNTMDQNYPNFNEEKEAYFAYEKLIQDIEEAILNNNDVLANLFIQKL